MTLVDTSIWISHLRANNPRLVAALGKGLVLMHPFVIGELACGNLMNRVELLHLLGSLPAAQVATEAEALAFIEMKALAGTGIGYLDVHLLASASLSNASLWTSDKKLGQVAETLGL